MVDSGKELYFKCCRLYVIRYDIQRAVRSVLKTKVICLFEKKCFDDQVDASVYKSGFFSKFYLEIDNESTSGGWIGWQTC
jgi:hypothetical protein